MIPFYILFSTIVFVISCTSEDQLLTEEGSGFEPPKFVNISVELVSNRVFDPTKNASNLKIVKDTVDDYSKKEGIKYPSDNIKQSIVDHGGKFAVFLRSKTMHDVMKSVDSSKEQKNIRKNYPMPF
uniref:Lipoprotein n=1 Tax=Caenorhabditis tropicalis TaxID=1561998 RepID=A0A1I7TSA6_9PELO